MKTFKKGEAPWEKQVDPEPQDEMSLLAQAGDVGLRALDYTSGLGRTAAMGLSDLARLAASGFDFDNFSPTSQVGDVTRMAKGDAPTTEEMLDRS